MLTKAEFLEQLYTVAEQEYKKELWIEGATHFVRGNGNPDSAIVFIGEAPGAEEDAQAKPFVGRSGKLLTKTLELFNTPRSNVFITNVVKCRPPNNRRPTTQEIAVHKDRVLYDELAILQPRIICTLGSTAYEALTGITPIMKNIRGHILQWSNIPILPTYHPAFILRNPAAYEIFKKDIQIALGFLTP